MERLLNTGVRLEAPASKRYENLFAGLEPGDYILHYTTQSLTKKEWRGKVIAVSKAVSRPYIVGKRIVADCDSLAMLPYPIENSQIRAISPMSEKMAKAIRMRLQAYLFQLEMSDYCLIIGPDNRKYLKTLGYL